jgi:cellulose synthase/poly-beta-1,6-N-acetylglucosamine synthase-like glycosyltransferase
MLFGLEHFVVFLQVTGLALAGYVLWRFDASLRDSLAAAPRLTVPPQLPMTLPTLDVVVPAYNEAVNIQDCVAAVLRSQLPDPQQLQVWIADDESTDETRAMAQCLVDQDARVHLVAVPPRPTDVRWMGKNWACTQAVAQIQGQTQGEYLLFIDADVRLKPEAIMTALLSAQEQQADLLSVMPQIECGCLAEWLVQPLMARMLIAGFNVGGVNDPAQPEIAFAAGPFMLFRRTAYDQIGGHQAVADQLVEDVALARRIKTYGLRMRLMLGTAVMTVRMYRSFGALWEGWTKNLHLGAQRRVTSTLIIALIAACFAVPFLVLLLSGIELVLGWQWATIPFCSATGLWMWESFRWRQQAVTMQLPLRYGWLRWLGGLLVVSIAIASIIKTETGWGWTWRGRPLALPQTHGKKP